MIRPLYGLQKRRADQCTGHGRQKSKPGSGSFMREICPRSAWEGGVGPTGVQRGQGVGDRTGTQSRRPHDDDPLSDRSSSLGRWYKLADLDRTGRVRTPCPSHKHPHHEDRKPVTGLWRVSCRDNGRHPALVKLLLRIMKNKESCLLRRPPLHFVLLPCTFWSCPY